MSKPRRAFLAYLWWLVGYNTANLFAHNDGYYLFWFLLSIAALTLELGNQKHIKERTAQ